MASKIIKYTLLIFVLVCHSIDTAENNPLTNENNRLTKKEREEMEKKIKENIVIARRRKGVISPDPITWFVQSKSANK